MAREPVRGASGIHAKSVGARRGRTFRDLDEWQMAELCEYIRETHRLMVLRSRRLPRLNGQQGGGR